MKRELEKEAEERATKFIDINFNEPDNYGSEKEVGHFSYYTGFLAGAETREKHIEELEKVCHDLSDKFDFQVKQVSRLETENELLKNRLKDFENQILGLLFKYESIYKRFPDIKEAREKAEFILKENAELKEKLLQEREIYWNKGFNYSKEMKAYMDKSKDTFKNIKEQIDTYTILDDENLKRQLSTIMNTYGIDNECSTPDHIIAEYLIDCLKSYKKIHNANRTWHGLPIEEEL